MMKKNWKKMMALTLAVTMLPMNVQAAGLDGQDVPGTENVVESNQETGQTYSDAISTETAGEVENVSNTEMPSDTEISDGTDTVDTETSDTDAGTTETIEDTESINTETPSVEPIGDVAGVEDTEAIADVVSETADGAKTDDTSEIVDDSEKQDDEKTFLEPAPGGDTSLIDAAVSEHADSDGDLDLPAFLQDGVASTGTISASQKLDPSSATVANVADVVRPIIYTNELGSSWNSKYGTVTKNDNGHGISIGILQWNATNALTLLKRIVGRNTKAESVIGTELYNKITTDTSWSGTSDSTRFIPTETQALAISNLLKDSIGTKAQDEMADEYLYTYLTTGFSTYKLRNAAALAYFCDINNQCGTDTVKRIATLAVSLAGGDAAKVTLNEIHEAALMDSVAGKYASRRYSTYKSIANAAESKKWNYYPSGSYRIPAAVVNSSTSKSEVSWLQWALNEMGGADLTVDGVYGTNTEKAVETFQKASKLTADGKAGQNTITALIKAKYSNNLAGVTPTLGKTSITSTGVKFTWKKVSKATGYYVYRKKVGGGYSRIATVKSGSTVSYTDKSAKNGTSYAYTVAAYNGVSVSAYNTTGKTVTYLKATTLKSATLTSSGIKLTWTKNSSANGYYVYRKVSGGSYKKIATIKSKSTVTYTDKSGKSGKKYTYRIYVYKGSVKSAVSGTKSQTYRKTVAYKTTSKLKYRTGAGTKYAAKGTLKKGKTVYIVSGYSKKANGYTWKKVLISGKIYYLASKFVKKK